MVNAPKNSKQSDYMLSPKIITIVFLIVCSVTVVMSFIYYSRLSSTIGDESKNYLREISSRIGSNIDRTINDNYAILYSMASVIENSDISNLGEASKTLQRQKSYWDYESILIIDETGKSYNLDNQDVFLSISDTMRDDILGGKPSMSTTQMVNNHEYIIFAVPLNNVYYGNTKVQAIAGLYDPLSFDKMLSMTSFDEQAYSQIVTRNGTVVTRSSSPFSMKTGYNVFSTISTSTLDSGDSIDNVMDDIKKGKSSQIGFTLDGVHRYMVYTPLYLDQWYLLTFVPAKTINAKSDMLLKSTLMICGLITATFAGLIVILMYTFNTNKQKLERMAYVDEVTGGNTVQRFYQISQKILDGMSSDCRFAIVYTNIEKFKVLNDQIGRQNCDTILKYFYNHLSLQMSENECIGRISADNFCLLLQFNDETSLVERFSQWQRDADSYVLSGEMPWPLPVTQFGIYVLDSNILTFPQMIDRAKLALKESPRVSDSRVRFAFYNDDIRRQLLRDKNLEDMMGQSLLDNEFQVYLQPKYSLPSEVIGGAEALVRWESKAEGMIFPNEFIPLFEKNGFIIQLDLWVFEQVCKAIKKWIDKDLPLIKISVNCSRLHFNDPNFLSAYCEVASRYNIPRQYVEIELTESVVFGNVDKLRGIIDDIHEAGFGCSMDDFGSGYSSLNMIQSITVDTIKLDRIFFTSDINDIMRTEAVVQSIISMAQALSMETVAEGVEIREHVEMLKRVGCNYIQGYVFAKPMKLSTFETLLFGEGRV